MTDREQVAQDRALLELAAKAAGIQDGHWLGNGEHDDPVTT